MMKKLILIFASLATFAGCEMLGLDFTFPDSEDKETPDLIMPKDTIYLLQEGIDSFESVFVNKDGYCMGIQKDTTFAYVAAIDSIDGKGALVIYFDEIGKVRRLHGKDHTIDLSYNSDGSVNLWYQDTDGTSEIVNDIILSSSKRNGRPTTKAGDVLDPMDFTALLALAGLTDVGKAVAMSPIIGSALKATVAADLLTSGKFSNLSTEVLTGVSSVAIAAIIGANLPLAALLAAINIANAGISDWQNDVANSYFGSAIPVTGEAVQLTDKHFVVSYSIADVDSGKTDFNVGVIVADGRFITIITKNHNLLKKTIPYSSNNGRIIINIGDLNPKKGDIFKYRVFIESTIDNGFKWDDMMLDYWRYGTVRNLVVDEPAIRINSTEQTNAEDNNGHSYTFDFNVSTSNEIPFEVDGWGVAIYETFSEKCESNDDLKDSKSAEGQGTKILAFTVNVNEVMMNTDREPYTPIINHFAVPYVSCDGHTYGIFDNAVKIKLEYKGKERPTPGQWVDLGLPSGIKWAGWNVGASRPEEYGGYYAWGETEEKSYYRFKEYKHRERTDYDHNHSGDGCWCWDYKYIGECISGTSYDVATVKWGGGARMPTLQEIQELVKYCGFEAGYLNDVAGNFVIGPNGNSIFTPFAGYRKDQYQYPYQYIIGKGNGGYYWSGTLHDDSCACYLECGLYNSGGRKHGLSVRPVSD
jgi:hypothetical protein